MLTLLLQSRLRAFPFCTTAICSAFALGCGAVWLRAEEPSAAPPPAAVAVTTAPTDTAPVAPITATAAIPPTPAPPPESPSALRARKLLEQAKATMMALPGLIADFQSNGSPTQYFDREGEITLQRDTSSFSIMKITGMLEDKKKMVAVCDGTTVTRMNEHDFIAYQKPLRASNFFLGHNFLVQYFFDSRPISFDPSDPTWGQSVSLFDKNREAHDHDVTIIAMGQRTLEGTTYEVAEIKYNVTGIDIRQQIYVGKDLMVYQVDTYFNGGLYSEKFRNYRINPTLSADTFRLQKTARMPTIATDPVRLGEPAPDFTLPDYNGHGDITLKELLKDKKGLLVCTIDGSAAKALHDADFHLRTMRTIQLVKDHFEKQGLMVVCIVGGPTITPDLTSELKLNWMPDVTRFNYPIAIDVDIERGIQGSAYENFQLGGRHTILLDKDGRVVFASYGFGPLNLMSFCQTMGQIGFTVSPADIRAMQQQP